MSELSLPDAMRLGAMNRPQAIGAYYDSVHDSTCALGAVLDAIGKLGNIGCRGQYLRNQFPVLAQQATNPVTGYRRHDLFSVIYDLNDQHNWTREQIADWLDTLEPVTVTDDAACVAS